MSYEIATYGAGSQGRPEPDPKGYCGGVRLAPWWRRVAAGLVDYAAPILLWPNIAMDVLEFGVNLTLWTIVAFVLYNSVWCPTEMAKARASGRSSSA